jgi:serine/threonine protein kinase/thioredoxin-like negative regulator of GroEL
MTKEHQFGQLAVQQRYITSDQLERALAEQSRLTNVLIGDLLVKMQFMSQAQTSAVLKLQLILVDELQTDKFIGKNLCGCLILQEIARGGVGVTYKAHHLNLDREVAIKILTESALADAKLVERFRREARAVARLSHPSIVGVYDFQDEEDFPYLVLEYVDGRTLRDVLSEQGKLPVKVVVWAALKITTALVAAHSKSVIHRDLRPENVLISKRSDVKLTDFGLTRPAGGRSHISDPGELYGAPQYLAPEQVEGLSDVDFRADYYSLGIILFECLIGDLPYKHAQAVQVLRAQTSDPLPDILEQRPECPPELALLIQELTDKQRQSRLVDPAIITARLHDIGRHWTSAPTMFPGVASRRPTALVETQETASADLEYVEEMVQRSNVDCSGVFEEIISSQSPEGAMIAYRIAARLWNQDRIDDLLALHSELQVAAVKDERVLILLGQSYRKKARLQEAMTCFRTAWLINNQSQKAGFELVRTLTALGRRDEAPRLMRKILEQHPKDSVVLERAGEFYHMEFGNDDLALEAYQRSLEFKDEKWSLLQRMGWIELERDNAIGALQYLERAARCAPEPAFSLKLLARAYQELQRISEAQDCLTISLRLDPSDLDTRMSLIETLKFQGHYSEVIKLCKQGLVDHPKDISLSLERAETLLLKGDYERSAKVFRRVLRWSPESERAKAGMISAQRARQQAR